MTKKRFDNYRFSINTQVMYYGEWVNVIEVYFDTRKVSINTGEILDYTEIKQIRQSQL